MRLGTTTTALALAAAALAQLPAAHAQDIYKCGNRYSQQPCGDARVLALDDSRTRQQQRQAAAFAQRDARLADSLEKDRLRQEAQAPVFVRTAATPTERAGRPSRLAPTPVFKVTGTPAQPATGKPGGKGKTAAQKNKKKPTASDGSTSPAGQRNPPIAVGMPHTPTAPRP